MTTEQRLDSIDTRLERLVAAGEQQQQETRQLRQSIQDLGQELRQSIQNLRQVVHEQGEVLSSGIGALAEQMTEFRITIQAQAETTDRLVGIVEQLITRQ